MKMCHRCKMELPITREFFPRHQGTGDGFAGVCRTCKKAARNRRNVTIRPVINKRQQLYRSKLSPEILEKNRLRARDWYTENRDRARMNVKTRYEKARAEMLVAFGPFCACCGETEPKFLTIDHINNDGGVHRRELGGSASSIVFDLQKRGFPKGEFQLLCYNCNCGRARNGGICPHKANGQKPICASVKAPTQKMKKKQLGPLPLFDMLGAAA